MKIIKDLFNNKLWIKVFISFFTLLLLLELCLTFLWNRQFVKTMQDKTFFQFIQNAQNANNHLEQQILFVEQLTSSLATNPDIINNLKNLSNRESYSSVHKTLNILKDTNPYILSGLLYISENNRVFGAGSTYDDNQFQNIPFIEQLRKAPDDPQNPNSYVQLNSKIFRLYTPVFSEGKYLGIILADINYDIINDVFISQTSDNTLSLLFDQNENLIFTTDSSIYNSMSKENVYSCHEILDEIKYSGEFYSLECNLLEKKYFGVAYRSSFTGLSNVLLTPIADINNSYFASDAFKMSIISSLLFFFMALILSILLGNSVIKRINNLKTHMIGYTLMLDSPEINISDSIIVKDEIDECYVAYSEMLNHIRSQIDEVYALNEQKRLLEINALEAQLSPHFLYNTLNTIRYLADNKNTEGVSKLSVALIDLLQFTLRNNSSLVTIDEEITYIKNYVSVTALNTQNQFHIQYHIPDEIKFLKIPKMLIQPIIENCFKHAFQGFEENIIIIKGALTDNELEFKIIDNGIGISKEQLNYLQLSLNNPEMPSKKIGLRNINTRLKTLFGKKYGISVFSVENMQTIITIRMPIIKEDNENEA